MKLNHTTSIIFLVFLFSSLAIPVYGQIEEPDLRVEERVSTPLNQNYNSGLTFDFVVNNFGFGIGGEYRKVIGAQMEGTISLRITGLRDASEQTFTDFFGQQAVPNKFQRAFAFPVMLGMRKRLFADRVQEEYRFFLSASAGPVMTFTYPYFDDQNNNGYREQFRDNFERINDIFSGWGDGDWHTGAAGELKFGVDFGRTFSSVTTVEFSYYFNYFPNGIQMMMPNQPVIEGNNFIVDGNGELVLEPFFDDQSFFGTPQISIRFGSLW